MEKAVLLRRAEDAVGPTFDEMARDYLLGVFDCIARDYSRTILRYWDWRPETIGLAPMSDTSAA